MSKKLIIKILVVLVVVAGLGAGGYMYIQSKSRSFSEKQVQYVLDDNHSAIYDNFIPATKEEFDSAEDFSTKFAASIFVAPSGSIRLMGETGGITSKNYTYQATRLEDTSKGYIIEVKTSGLINKKIVNIGIQEANILKN